MQHPELNLIYAPPPPPEGYVIHLAPRNKLVAWRGVKHPQQEKSPILYLDEKAMVWRELDRHISEVGDARKTD